MEVAHLGYMIDSAGARHEISATSEQLRILANGGREAAIVMDQLNAAVGGGPGGQGPIPPDVPPRINRFTESIRKMREAASQRIDLGFQGQISDLDPFQSKLEAIQARGDQVRVSLEKMRVAGREKLDLGLSTQIEQLDPFQKGLGNIESQSTHARIGMGRLANQVTDLGARLSGVHPIIGKIVEVLGQMAVGHGLTLAVIGGITAIAFAWDKFTEATRKATEEQNKLAQSARDTAMTRALGPGGDLANQATAVAGRIHDLGEDTKGFWSDVAVAIRSALPHDTGDILEQQFAKPKREADLYAQVLKGLNDEIASARVQNFVQGISASFDYAAQRGQSVLGMYGDLSAAQTQLNALALSGNQAIKNAALQGLQQVSAYIDKIRLQNMGLAEAPGQVRGLPSATYTGALSQTVSTLSTGLDVFTKHGYDIDAFRSKITSLWLETNKAMSNITQYPQSVRNAIQQAADEIETMLDALALSAARKLGPQALADQAVSIRNNAITPQAAMDVALLQNAKAQRQYGIDLAVREAAIKLPDVFDAVREAALSLKEGLRQAKRQLETGLAGWGITTTTDASGQRHFQFSTQNIRGGIQEGATQAVGNILTQYSPANITANLVNSAANYMISGITDTITSWLDGGAAAREYRRHLKEVQAQFEAGIAAFTGNNLAQQLASNEATAAQLTKLAQDAYGSVYSIIHGSLPKLIGAMDSIGAAAARNAQQILIADARQRVQAQEDLAVRLLRAQGRQQEADDLAFRNQQEREYQAAHDKAMQDGIISTAEAQYLASLLHVQAAEKIAHAMGILNDAVRNAPTGFDPAAYGLGQNYYGPTGGSSGGGYTPSGFPVGRLPQSAGPGAGGRPQLTVIQVSIPQGGIIVQGEEDPQTIARKVVQGAVEYGSASVGANVPLATMFEMLRYAPTMPSR